MLAALAAGLEPSGDEARRWAQEELAKSKYASGTDLFAAIGDWIGSLLEKVFSWSPDAPSGTIGLSAVVFFLILAVVLALLLGRLRRGSRVPATAPTVILDDSRPLSSLLSDARAAHARGDFAAACLDYYRATIRTLDASGHLRPFPGMTAREAAWQGETTTRLGLTGPARLFDSIAYGGGSADASDAEELARLVGAAQHLDRTVVA